MKRPKISCIPNKTFVLSKISCISNRTFVLCNFCDKPGSKSNQMFRDSIKYSTFDYEFSLVKYIGSDVKGIPKTKKQKFQKLIVEELSFRLIL